VHLAQVEAAVNRAKCSSVALFEPKPPTGDRYVFQASIPRRGGHVSPGHTLEVGFKIVKPTKK
jgi:hypothetical protein